MPLTFHTNYKPTCSEYNQLVVEASLSHPLKEIGVSASSFLRSKTIKLCVLKDNCAIVSFCFYMERIWFIDKQEARSLSLGLVTTCLQSRRRGYGRSLIQGIENFAEETGIHFIYLQGIDGYYNKIGYRSLGRKSKINIDLAKIQAIPGELVPARISDVDSMQTLYSKYCRMVGTSIIRSRIDWEDLLENLRDTFVFNSPHLIIGGDGRIIGYICTSKSELGLITEFIPDPNFLFDALGILRAKLNYCAIDQLSIYSPMEGLGDSLESFSLSYDFISYFRPSSGNLYKVVGGSFDIAPLLGSFLFQGDNL